MHLTEHYLNTPTLAEAVAILELAAVTLALAAATLALAVVTLASLAGDFDIGSRLLHWQTTLAL